MGGSWKEALESGQYFHLINRTTVGKFDALFLVLEMLINRIQFFFGFYFPLATMLSAKRRKTSFTPDCHFVFIFYFVCLSNSSNFVRIRSATTSVVSWSGAHQSTSNGKGRNLDAHANKQPPRKSSHMRRKWGKNKDNVIAYRTVSTMLHSLSHKKKKHQAHKGNSTINKKWYCRTTNWPCTYEPAIRSGPLVGAENGKLQIREDTNTHKKKKGVETQTQHDQGTGKEWKWREAHNVNRTGKQ